MNKAIKSTLFWSPRVLCILFALFLVIFSFDVFGEGRGFWSIVVAFLMHNIPSMVILLVLWLTWRREWIGAIFYAALGIVYEVVWAWGKFPLSVYFAIAGPLFVVGILLLLNWFYRADLRPHAEPSGTEPTPSQE